MPDLLDAVHIVLLRPRWASNLGAVARAMRNFGLHRLTLVDSRIGSWSDAWRMAVQAQDVLANAASTADLAAALAPAHWVVGTTNDPPAGMRVLSPREVAAEAVQRGAPTLLFGGEIDGLGPAELLRCHAASVIPTAPAQSSLNLAQAVCVYAAELFAAHGARAAPPAPPPASTAMLQRLEAALRRLLEASAWADASRGKHAIAELVQPLRRAQLTDDEVRAWLVALGKATRPRAAPGGTTAAASARRPDEPRAVDPPAGGAPDDASPSSAPPCPNPARGWSAGTP
ncbi:MAG: rRNA methyltransferase [Planctomycetes bacterium]|nr:rRNA methyltransferase [Planctomycetota bacterium]